MAASQPPAGREQRRHPRIELYATVELRSLGETLILSIRNISLGGVFLTADGQDLSSIVIGSEEELVVFDGSDDDKRVVVNGRVVRRDADGIALTWVGEDSIFKIATLVDRHSLPA
jgi:PilZ domain-containing protein